MGMLAKLPYGLAPTGARRQPTVFERPVPPEPPISETFLPPSGVNATEQLIKVRAAKGLGTK